MGPEDERVRFLNKRRYEDRPRDVVALRTGSTPGETTAPEPIHHEHGVKHPEYPLERLCTHRYEPFQLTFARHAQQLLGGHDDVELVASHQGLTIRAETEDAIDSALEALKDFHGSQIRIGPPTIRYHSGETLEQPWMGLRIRCDAEDLEKVRKDLNVRGAVNLTCAIHLRRCAIQACAPLARLIGYRRVLARLTSGSARCVMWLSHYAPVENLPPDGDAA